MSLKCDVVVWLQLAVRNVDVSTNFEYQRETFIPEWRLEFLGFLDIKHLSKSSIHSIAVGFRVKQICQNAHRLKTYFSLSN